jgi:hypothetical protein
LIDFTQRREARKERFESGVGRVLLKGWGRWSVVGVALVCVPLELLVGAACGALAPVAWAEAGFCGSRLETGWRGVRGCGDTGRKTAGLITPRRLKASGVGEGRWFPWGDPVNWACAMARA